AADGIKGGGSLVEATVKEGDGEVKGNGATRGEAPRAPGADADPAETREWLDALDSVLQTGGVERAQFLLAQIKNKAVRSGVLLPFTANTPYINTIPRFRQPLFPGNREM